MSASGPPATVWIRLSMAKYCNAGESESLARSPGLSPGEKVTVTKLSVTVKALTGAPFSPIASSWVQLGGYGDHGYRRSSPTMSPRTRVRPLATAWSAISSIARSGGPAGSPWRYGYSRPDMDGSPDPTSTTSPDVSSSRWV